MAPPCGIVEQLQLTGSRYSLDNSIKITDDQGQLLEFQFLVDFNIKYN